MSGRARAHAHQPAARPGGRPPANPMSPTTAAAAALDRLGFRQHDRSWANATAGKTCGTPSGEGAWGMGVARRGMAAAASSLVKCASDRSIRVAIAGPAFHYTWPERS